MFNTLEFVREKLPFLEAKEALKIISNTEIRKVKAGEILIKQGTVAPIACYIAKGLFRAYVSVDGVEEKTIIFRKEKEFIGAPPSMFRDEPSQEAVVALEDSVILIVDWKGFREISGKSVHLAKAYSHIVEDMMLEAVDRIQDFTILSPEERYLKFRNGNQDV